MKTFDILEAAPATSDNSDALIKVDTNALPLDNEISMPTTMELALTDARFTKARVGSALPLCCPQHPLVSCFNAQTAKDLDLNFCQVVCNEKLVCSHSCRLKCHWTKHQQHNQKCKIPVDSPCSKHPERLECMEVYKNAITGGQQSPIDEVLKNYHCPKKVSVILPCSHEEDMLCWQEDNIAVGNYKFPECNRQSLRPYVYPDCGHRLELSCAHLEQYTNNPSLVKPCTELVEYRPSNCTHVKKIKCYLDTEYRTGKRDFVCSEKLTVVLPRCGHEVKHVTCGINVDLEKWSGCEAEEVGIVQEGVQYGPKDHICVKPSKCVRICGHEEATTCNKAFEMAELKDIDEQKPAEFVCLLCTLVVGIHAKFSALIERG